jgi:hypothetical protein
MESTPSSGSETPAPLTHTATPAPTGADASWVRSRRVHTFALGALVGALALSLVVVVTAVFAAVQGDRSPLPAEPAPVSEVRVTPRASPPAPTSSPSPTPPVTPAEPETDAADGGQTDPAIEPAPAPAPTAPATEENDSSSGPGNSGSAPGRTKEPKKP